MMDVKSASWSLEWTTPNVPKPLNENIDGARSPAARTPAGYHSNATSMMACTWCDVRHDLERLIRLCIVTSVSPRKAKSHAIDSNRCVMCANHRYARRETLQFDCQRAGSLPVS